METLVRSFYTRRLTNDPDAVIETFAPDARFIMAGSPAASRIAIRAETPEDMHGLVRILVGDWRWTGVDFHAIIIDENRAAVHYRLSTEHVPTGRTVESDLVDLMTVRDGKIAEFTEFVDTALAERVMCGTAD